MHALSYDCHDLSVKRMVSVKEPVLTLFLALSCTPCSHALFIALLAQAAVQSMGTDGGMAPHSRTRIATPFFSRTYLS